MVGYLFCWFFCLSCWHSCWSSAAAAVVVVVVAVVVRPCVCCRRATWCCTSCRTGSGSWTCHLGDRNFRATPPNPETRFRKWSRGFASRPEKERTGLDPDPDPDPGVCPSRGCPRFGWVGTSACPRRLGSGTSSINLLASELVNSQNLQAGWLLGCLFYQFRKFILGYGSMAD